MPKKAEYGIDWYAWRGTYRVYRGGIRKETLPIAPDSAEWFELLKEIGSFRFEGKKGVHTAVKQIVKGHPYWYAVVWRNYRKRKVYLGKWFDLTIDTLERAAKVLEGRVSGTSE